MSAVPKTLLTPQEYLARERKAAYKSEYYRGEMFAMAGASEEHCLAKDNLAREVGMQLKGGPCKVVTSDLRVKVDATGLYTYPDVVIYCGKAEFEDDHFDILLNPTALVEVLSDSTEKYDRGKKFHHYQRIATLQEYILVAQDEPLVERFVRQPSGDWLVTKYAGFDATLEFTSVPVRVLLADIYRGIEFPSSPPQ
ncbi:MAG: Uma2 family endonuclease [Gemmataceae bacterium]